jgi:hypothetical protein
MRDRAAERSLFGSGRVDMDELPIFGRVGESVDPRLIDLDPARHADFFADLAPDLVEAGERH